MGPDFESHHDFMGYCVIPPNKEFTHSICSWSTQPSHPSAGRLNLGAAVRCSNNCFALPWDHWSRARPTEFSRQVGVRLTWKSWTAHIATSSQTIGGLSCLQSRPTRRIQSVCSRWAARRLRSLSNRPVRIGRERYSLYVHSYLDYGQDNVVRWNKQHLYNESVRSHPTRRVDHLDDPCMFDGTISRTTDNKF